VPLRTAPPNLVMRVRTDDGRARKRPRNSSAACSKAKRPRAPHAPRAETRREKDQAHRPALVALSSTGAEAPAKPRGGQCLAWKQRQPEALAKLAELFPTIRLRPEYADPERWQELVKGKDSKIEGNCSRCGKEVRASLHNLLSSGQGFKNCRCNPLPKIQTRQELRAAREEAVLHPSAILEGIQSRAFSSEELGHPVPVTSGEAGAERAATTAVSDDEAKEGRQDASAGKLGGWIDRQQEFVELMRSRFPHVRLDESFQDPDGWAECLGKQKHTNVKISATCSGCGERLSALLQNLVKTKYQGFGASNGVPCKCHVKATALAKARQRLPANHQILHVELRETSESKKVQNCTFVITKCTTCQKECKTKVKTLLATKGPACWCSGNAPWKGEGGYQHMISILTERKDSRHYEAAFDLAWWIENVSNINSVVPLRCTLCAETVRCIRVSNIQNGTSVGCQCRLHGASTLRNFLRQAFPDATLSEEVFTLVSPETGRTLKGDFALFQNADTRQSDLAHICQVLGLDEARATSRSIVVELDGDAHFSERFDGHYKPRYARNDLLKEERVLKDGGTIIRLTQRSIMWSSPGGVPWKDFLKLSVAHALTRGDGGCVLHQDLPCYTTWEESAYVRERRPPSTISNAMRVEKIPGLCERVAVPAVAPPVEIHA